MMEDDKLYHYGTPRHSGRYPWGSGKDPYQHAEALIATVESYKKKGMSNTEIAKALGYSTTEYNKIITNVRTEKRAEETRQWQKLRDDGWSYNAIAKRYGLSNESTVRDRLKNSQAEKRVTAVDGTAQMLKDRLEENPYIDISAGSENLLGITSTTLDKAVSKLTADGYKVQPIFIPQVTNPSGKNTVIKILSKDDVDQGEILANKDQIRLVTDWVSNDDGRSWLGIKKPESVSSDRVMVRYAEEGGTDMDGVIELRRGVEDLSLGGKNYAQVRIAVDGTHYLKGMAVYSDNLPDGVDIRFNTNKSEGTPMIGPKDNSVLKPMKKDKATGDIDWSNPFGSLIKIEEGHVVGQHEYTGADGKQHLSAVNIVKEEGDWNEWSKNLSSQFLSKQNEPLIKKQLNLAYDVKKDQFNDIMELTSPEVKSKMLLEFADECDSAAVHLKAAALPRQSTKVILPVPGLKENEVYAPTYKDGEEVILVRHPHAGPFEIPVLKVNNRSKDGKSIVGSGAIDAIGIHPKAAQQLSGADFDGDTVIVIPTKDQKLNTSKPLPELKDFDPSHEYPAYEGMPRVGPENGFHKQTEMGKISNLITDMTIRGAKPREIARAVKHSMVVIDAEKHNLNWQASERDNNIAELKELYQGGANRGASTLISRAKSTEWVDDRKVDTYEYVDENGKKKRYAFDPETGDVTYTKTGKTMKRFVDIESGKKVSYTIDPETKERVWTIKGGKGKDPIIVDEANVQRMDTGDLKKGKSSQMAERSNALDLSSGTLKETMYGNYANQMKDLARAARKAVLSVGATEFNKSAETAYKTEVDSLKSKLKIAESNAPYERQAQVIATKRIEERLKADPTIRNDKDAVKKLRTEALTAARNQVGASRQRRLVNITDREWDAILSGALHKTTIERILRNANPDQVKKLATPKNSRRTISSTQRSRIQAMSSAGRTLDEIASAIGVSPTTIYRVLNE